MNTVPTQNKWYNKTWLVVILCILFFPVGLYALWKNIHISRTWKIIVTVFFAGMVLAQYNKNEKSLTKNTSEESDLNSKSQDQTVGIGQPLKTEYFEITVNKANLTDRINTGNQFTDLDAESDINYLVLNTTFKNIDNESRMIIEGSIWINYNGKDYEFDKSEVIMLEDWNLALATINPLTSKTGNIVYKIPKEIKGDAYYQPGRTLNDEKIYLGTF